MMALLKGVFGGIAVLLGWLLTAVLWVLAAVVVISIIVAIGPVWLIAILLFLILIK